ncbi:DNA topoisomerase IB [Rhodobacterales bacterium HKCCE4037]|nr:DNA topoisomerase IB [Rhodobacterales bacterium HKCCE4037]
MAAIVCRQIGLRHYPDCEPGIRRERRGRGFSYIAPDGARITDATKRDALNALAIPPAYADVWICPFDDGHLIATGLDEAERKQYRYHPKWTSFQQSRKFASLAELGERLPKLRSWVARRLSEDAEGHDGAVAAVIGLMERHSLRVGNRKYSLENGSFAATTLKRRHLHIKGTKGTLIYTAKGGRDVEKPLRGRTLIERLGQGPDSPGSVLAGWRDGQGKWRAVSPAAVRERLSDIVGLDVTPRLLRTWNGSRAAFLAARGVENATLKSVSEAAAQELHNTPAIARSSYIHPAIIATVREGKALPNDGKNRPKMRAGEGGLLDLLT